MVDARPMIASDDDSLVEKDVELNALKNSLIAAATIIGSSLFKPVGILASFLTSMIPIGPKVLSPDAMYDAIKQKIQVQIDTTLMNVLSNDYAQKISTIISTLRINLQGFFMAVNKNSNPEEQLHLIRSNLESSLPNWFRFSGDIDVNSRFVICSPLNIGLNSKSCLHLENGKIKDTQNLLADDKDISIDSLDSMLFTDENGKLEYVQPNGQGKMCVGFDKNGTNSNRFLSIRNQCPISFTIQKTSDQLWEIKTNTAEYSSYNPSDHNPIFCVGKKKPVLVTTHGTVMNECRGGKNVATLFKYKIPIPVDSKDKSNVLSFAVLDTLLRNLPMLAFYHLISLKSLYMAGFKSLITSFKTWIEEYKKSIDVLLPVYETYINYTKGKVDENSNVPRESHIEDLLKFRADLDKATMNVVDLPFIGMPLSISSDHSKSPSKNSKSSGNSKPPSKKSSSSSAHSKSSKTSTSSSSKSTHFAVRKGNPRNTTSLSDSKKEYRKISDSNEESLTKEGKRWKDRLLKDNTFFNHLGSWLKDHGYIQN